MNTWHDLSFPTKEKFETSPSWKGDTQASHYKQIYREVGGIHIQLSELKLLDLLKTSDYSDDDSRCVTT